MSPTLFSLTEDTTIESAAQFFASHRLTTAPVLCKNGEILGVLTDFQLLRSLLKTRQDNKNATLQDIREDLDPVVTVNEDDSIVNAFRMMIESANHRIFTMQNNQLCGVLSPKDLLQHMAGVKSEDKHELDSVAQKQLESVLKELLSTRRQLNEYQQLFQDSPYLMHSVDMNGKIINANKMIHYVLGYDDGELVGKSLRQLYPPENYKHAMDGLDTVFSLGFHPLVSVVMMKKEGESIRVDVASTLKKDASGNPEGTITVGRLSDSYRMINYLQKAAKVYSNKKNEQKKSG